MSPFKLTLFFFLASIHALYSQTFEISGVISDSITHSPLIGASLIVKYTGDTTQWKGGITDIGGRFRISGLGTGDYNVRISFVSYKTSTFNLTISDRNLDLGVLKLGESIHVLKGVVVEGQQSRAQQSGDTTQFNANAYKTNPDANAEDLVTKMPGVATENGAVKVNGENVQQVLIDGKPFFGDDPNAALRNLPAEVIDKIQVFDRLSEQSQFTGFDDGNTAKTINIITKPGMNNGQFGRLFAGYGSDERYLAGGNINVFNGDRRFSIIGLSNNINQQNFSTEDLVGAVGTSSNRGRGGQGGNAGGRGAGQGRRGGGNGGSDISNFMVGQQGGISTTHAFGLNYSDSWGDKIKITGSYFFNNGDNINRTVLTRQYLTAADSGLFYNENIRSDGENYNHRLNARIEYNLDSFNSIIIAPRLSLQRNNSFSFLDAGTTTSEAVAQSNTSNNTLSRAAGLNFSNNLLFRHRFKKRGRTISFNLRTDFNDRDNNRQLKSSNRYFEINDSTFLNQNSKQVTGENSYSGNISYTEPVGKTGQLQLSYSPSYSYNRTNKETRNYDDFQQEYVYFDTALSNQFSSDYNTNRMGISYRINDRKLSFNAGADLQYATLSGNQVFPEAHRINRFFRNVLPTATFNYRYSNEKNLRIGYRTNTNVPSVNQLQNVLDNSNPLLLTTGNPGLLQEYNHRIFMRYGNTNALKARSLFLFLTANYTENYLGNATYIPLADSTTVAGILLNRGVQLSRPVNLNGYWNARSFLTYSFPLKLIKSNFNLSTGFTFNRIPASINERVNLANNYNLSKGVGITSNISEKIDFNITYTANYSIVKNTFQEQSDNNYFFHNTSLKLNLLPWKGLVLNTNLNHTLYAGLAQSFNQEFLLWNAAIGYKLLKNKSLEVKASVYDLLNQNNSITRNVTETFIEDSETSILRRYFMFTVTYTIRKVKKP